jgi:hypothetical protein
MAEAEIAKHTKKVYKVWASKEHSWQHKAKEFFIEIAIIVFAVSISIWFHNLSEKSHDRKEAKQYLEGLKKDLVLDVQEMKRDSSFLSEQLRLFSYLAEVKKGNLDTIIINRDRRLFFTDVYLRPNVSRFEALKFSGKMNLIEDKELLDEIINLYEERIPIVVNSGTEVSTFREKMILDYIDSFQLFSEKREADFLNFIQTDETLKYYCGRFADRTMRLMGRYHDLIKSTEKLIKMIEKEIK